MISICCATDHYRLHFRLESIRRVSEQIEGLALSPRLMPRKSGSELGLTNGLLLNRLAERRGSEQSVASTSYEDE